MEVLLVAIVAVILTPLELISSHIVLPNSVLNQTTKFKREIPSIPAQGPGPEPPLTWTENWTVFDNYHNQNLTRVYLNKIAHVAVYFDPDVHPNSTWIFEFTSKVWAYMTQTYGHFGPDHYLYVIIHQGRYKGGHKASSLYGERNMHNKRNVIDEASLHPYGWHTGGTRSDEMTQLTKRLAYFVEFSSKERRGSPSRNVWTRPSYKDTAWVDIFTYDVLMNLNLTSYADQFNSSATMKSEIIPRKYTFWFRDWLLPIYKEYGGREVLNKYFVLLKWNFPAANDIYVESLNMGEFVHFWSGAAKSDLTELAKTAFGWNPTFADQLVNARKTFPLDYTEGDRGRTVEIPVTVENVETGKLEVNHVIIGASIIAVGIMALVAKLCIDRKKNTNSQAEIRDLTQEEVKGFFEGGRNANQEDENQALVLSMPFLKDFEISRDRLIPCPTKVIGSGQFGLVMHGFIQNPDNNGRIPVALKTVKADVEVTQFKAMLSEAKIMAYLGRHDHIVPLLGTFTANIKNREIFLALELHPLGDLHKFLQKNRHNYKNMISAELVDTTLTLTVDVQVADQYSALNTISTLDLLKWAQEISNAMVYLTDKKVIHGDLAARNVLLTRNRIVQISDFGLSRQLLNYANYKKKSDGPLPWRWMAIEALNDMKFSIASDIWAYGVTLWEMFSLATIPYAGWVYNYSFLDRLIRGERLESPQFANDEIFELMKNCWKLEPRDRLRFDEIHYILGGMISQIGVSKDEVENTEGD